MMASVVPLGFSVFLSKHKPSVQELCQRQFAGRRLHTPVTRSMGLNPPNCSGRGMCAVNSSCFWRVTVARNFCEPISHHFSVISSPHVIISGFWVGPDIDDGWGFVEAFVHRT